MTRFRLRRGNWPAPQSGSSTCGPHRGAHPRFGALDVVPWVALEGRPFRDVGGVGQAGCAERARQARDSFARWVSDELAVPVFLYGPERSLPESAKASVGRLAAGLRAVGTPSDRWRRSGGVQADDARLQPVAGGIRY